MENLPSQSEGHLYEWSNWSSKSTSDSGDKNMYLNRRSLSDVRRTRIAHWEGRNEWSRPIICREAARHNGLRTADRRTADKDLPHSRGSCHCSTLFLMYYSNKQLPPVKPSQQCQLCIRNCTIRRRNLYIKKLAIRLQSNRNEWNFRFLVTGQTTKKSRREWFLANI